MVDLSFEDLSFEDLGKSVLVSFLDWFCFEIEKGLLKHPFEVISPSKVRFEGLGFSEAKNYFNGLVDSGFLHLRSKITGNSVTYVNSPSGIPLIGSSAFGIVDRNSSMIEIKPVTGCNMNCIFCSVDEGLSSRKVHELIIDKDYLVSETSRLVEFKDCSSVHLTINAHGEPLTYKPMPELVRDLSGLEKVETVSLITNGTLLTESCIDLLAEAGLSRLNVSLNAVSPKAAKVLEGHGKYDVSYVKRMCEYAAGKLPEVVLAPVFVPGYNDSELAEIVKFAKRIGAKVGIQNYLRYKKGRNPRGVKEMPWDKFYSVLRKLEEDLDFKLVLDEQDFGIVKTRHLPKPFKKDQVVSAVVKCPGRYGNEVIASASDRSLTITNLKNFSRDLKVKVKITSDKHNLFFARVL